MTKKDTLRNLIKDGYTQPIDDGATATINNFVDGLTEEQAAALLTLDGFPITYEDGTREAWSIGNIIRFMLSISNEHAKNSGNQEGATMDDVKDTVKGFATRAHKQGSTLEATKEFWQGLTDMLETDDVQSFASKIPSAYILTTGKVPNLLPDIPYSQQASVQVSRKRAKPIKTYIQLDYAGKEIELSGKTPPEAFDYAIYNGILSLVDAGNAVFTDAMAYRAMAGMDDTQDISPTQEQQARESIARLMNTRARIDASEEIRAYRKSAEEWIVSDYLLSAREHEVKINGVKAHAYEMAYNKDGSIRPPILLEYAQLSGQVLRKPASVARLPINTTKRAVILRDYLFREIGWMKKGNEGKASKRSDTISYSTIYQKVGIDLSKTTAKIETSRIRTAAKAILTQWQAQNEIASFNEVKEGRQITGIKITF